MRSQSFGSTGIGIALMIMHRSTQEYENGMIPCFKPTLIPKIIKRLSASIIKYEHPHDEY